VWMEPVRSCFAPGIRGWAKHISGKWRGSLKKQNFANGPKYWFPSDRQHVRSQEDNIAVAGLYCDFLRQQEQTTTNIMGAILKRLAGRGGIPDYLREAFQKGKWNLVAERRDLPT